MLISDDTVQVRHLTEIIEGFGSTVIHAHDAMEAFSILAEVQLVPDAFVIDDRSGEDPNGVVVYLDLKEKYGPVPCAIITRHQTAPSRKTSPGEICLLQSPMQRNQLHHFLSHRFDEC